MKKKSWNTTSGEPFIKDEFEANFDEQQDTSWETDDDYDDFPEDEYEEYDYEDYEAMYEDIDEIEDTIDDLYNVGKYREFKIKLNRQ